MTQLNNSPFHHYEWTPPQPLPEGAPLLPWPSDVFPEPFETFVQELAQSTETPVELAAMITLSTVAGIAQKTYEIQIKEDYTEPVNIWSAGILPPASRKSRVFSVTINPLREWESEQSNAKKTEINSIESKRKTIDARLKHMRNLAAKGKDEKDFISYQEKIEKLEMEMPETPAFPQIWTGDVTPEQLGTIMAVNDEAMAVLSDEGGIFDILSGLYSDGRANIDLFLQSHAASPVRVDRGSRPPILMQRPVLTMGLAIQPKTIMDICSNKTFRGRGLLGRFLYVVPKSNIGKRKLDVPAMSKEIKTKYNNAIKSIFSHKPPPKESDFSVHRLRMTPDAYNKWLEYAIFIERSMGDEIGHLTHITDWAGKLPGAIARIAALLHIMRFAHSCPWEHVIEIKEMQSAIKIGHCLINHALIVFDQLQNDESVDIARSIYNWIKSEQLQQFTLRDCERKFRRFKKNKLNNGLETLQELGYLKEWKLQRSKGAPSDVFDVSPLIFDNEK